MLHVSFSLIGDSWLGLNDRKNWRGFVWEGTAIPYSWSPNTLHDGSDEDYVKIQESSFFWEVRPNEKHYVICQNISGTHTGVEANILDK